MDISTWQKQGEALARAHNTTTPWAISDWLLQGERVGADSKYKTAAAILKWTPASCRNYASVARTFPPAERHNDMTFGHHVAVAALEPEERRQLLDRAVAEKLSVAKLRAAVRELKGEEKKTRVSEAVALKVGTILRVKGKDYSVVKIDDGVHACSSGWLSVKLQEVADAEPEPPAPEPPANVRNVTAAQSPDDFVPAGTVLETPPLFDEPVGTARFTAEVDDDFTIEKFISEIKEGNARRLVEHEARLNKIKSDFRVLAKKFHPDVNPDGSEQFRQAVKVYKESLKEEEERWGYTPISQRKKKKKKKGAVC